MSCFPLADSTNPDRIFLSGFLKPVFQQCCEWEASVVKCWRIFWNISELLGLTAPLGILLCRPGALYILCLCGKKGELGRLRIPSEPRTWRSCATAWSSRHPPPSLRRLTWERAVWTRTLFFFWLKESRQYFVSKSFVKGPSYRPKLLLLALD